MAWKRGLLCACSCVLQIRKSGIMERTGWRRVELTFTFICQFLPHVNSSCVHIVFFAPAPYNGLATGVQAWPDLTWPAHCVSTLPRERWVVRALNWLPEHSRRVGRPAYSLGLNASIFLQAQTNRKLATLCPRPAFWMNQLYDFISFTEIWWTWNVDIICSPAPWKGCQFWHASLTLTHSLFFSHALCGL